MAAPNWQHRKSILHAAMDLDPSERVAFINRSCAGHPELGDRVKRLLDSPHELERLRNEPPVIEADLVATSVARASRP